MVARIYIAIPCHNRKSIIERCIPTIAETKTSADYLELWADGCTEYDSTFLTQWADRVNAIGPDAKGIEMQRRAHFQTFMDLPGSYSHMYLTDSDAPHDPNWRSQALGLQEENDGAPVCLYNTKEHANMKGNTLEDDITKNVIWRYYAPGISYFLTRAHVEKIAAFGIKDLRNWDWDVPRILGHRMAVSRVSYVEHIGHGGIHHPSSVGFEGGDRALNPTPWLVAKRAEIVEELSR